MSAFMTSDGTEIGKYYPSLGLGNSFAFKFEDFKGRVHRLNCGECMKYQVKVHKNICFLLLFLSLYPRTFFIRESISPNLLKVLQRNSLKFMSLIK